MSIKIGVTVPLPPPLPGVAPDTALLAREAERLGFESIWVPDHPIAPVHVTSYSPTFEKGQVPGFTDPLVCLAMASAVTSTIRLGTGVLLVPERNPLALAKAIATLDLYSGGRVLLGVGAGWNQQESEMLGVDFPHRWGQTREAVAVMKALWTQEQAEHHGTYYNFPPVRCFPKPARKPHPPIHIGGWAKNVHSRIVQWADGWLPHRATPATLLEGRRALDALAKQAGRDPRTIETTAYNQPPDMDVVRAFQDVGADRIVMGMPIVESDAEAMAELRKIAHKVLR